MKKLVVLLAIVLLIYLPCTIFAQSLPQLMLQRGHARPFKSMDINVSESLVLTSGGNTVKMWDIKTGRLVYTFDASAVKARFSDDGTQIYTVNSFSITIYDVHTKKLIKEVTLKAKGSITQIYFIPKTNRVLVRDHNGNVFWQDYISGVYKTFRVPKASCINLSPDGKQVLINYYSQGASMGIWDLKSGELIRKISGKETNNIYESIAFSPDRKYIMARYRSKIRVWDSQTFKLLNTFENGVGGAHLFSPDGSKIIRGGRNNLEELDIKTGKKVNLLPNNNNIVFALKLNSSGSKLLIGSEPQTIYVMDLKSRQILQTIKGNMWIPHMVRVSPDGKRMMVAGKSGYKLNFVRFINLETGVEERMYQGFKSTIQCVDVSPDGNFFAAADLRKVNIWELKTGRLLHSFKLSSKKGWGYPVSLSFSENGSKLLVALDRIRVFTLSTLEGKVEKEFKFKFRLKSAYFMAGSQKILVNFFHYTYGSRRRKDSDPYAQAIEYNTGRKVQDFNDKGFEYTWFSPRKTFFTNFDTPLTQPQLKLWDGKTGKLLKEISGIQRIDKVALSPNDQMAIIAENFDKREQKGTEIGMHNVKLINLKTGKIIRSYNAHSRFLIDLTFINNERFVSVSADNTVKIWSVDQSVPLSTLYFGIDNYFFLTKEGYFTGNKEGIKDLVHYQYQNKLFLFDQFDLRYNRPDKVLESIGITPRSRIKMLLRAYIKRLKKSGFSQKRIDLFLKGEFSKGFNTPEIIRNDKSDGGSLIQTDQPRYKVQFTAIDKKYPLDRFNVYVNGVPLYGRNGISVLRKNRLKLKKTIRIPLSKSKNTIEISVLNNQAVESLREQIKVIYIPRKNSPKPNLHIVSLGVSKYKTQSYNLNYAHKDAQDIVKAFKQNGQPRFGKVITHELHNEGLTTTKVKALKQQLLKTKVDDHVIVFYAGHGLLDEKLDYYLGTHHIDFENPSKGGLAYEDLESIIDGIPARQKLLLVDACHSGEVDKDSYEEVKAKVESKKVKFRGFPKTQTNQTKIQQKTRQKARQKIGLQNSYELMKSLFTDLRKSTGSTVLSSAGGGEFALESEEWNNGVFTYSLLDGLKNLKADLNKDGKVMLSELQKYLGNRVQELTNGQQKPTSRVANLSNDFRVW